MTTAVTNPENDAKTMLHELRDEAFHCQYNRDRDGAIALLKKALAIAPADKRCREELHYLEHTLVKKGMSLFSYTDQASGMSVIKHTSLQNEQGNDEFTRAIGEAFILRGKEYERRGQFIEATRDYMCALAFNYNHELKWDDRYTENEPEYELQVHCDLELTYYALRSLFSEENGKSPYAEKCKMLPGYFVVIEGVVVGQFPLDEYGREEAVSFANQIVGDERTRRDAVDDFDALNFDDSEIPKVFEYLGQGQPQLIHSPEDMQVAVTAR